MTNETAHVMGKLPNLSCQIEFDRTNKTGIKEVFKLPVPAKPPKNGQKFNVSQNHE